MADKTIIGSMTVAGEGFLVYSDGTFATIHGVDGANGTYFVVVPVEVVAGLKAEDSQNADFSDLPGYQSPGDESVSDEQNA